MNQLLLAHHLVLDLAQKSYQFRLHPNLVHVRIWRNAFE
jgi:hypothetical protein